MIRIIIHKLYNHLLLQLNCTVLSGRSKIIYQLNLGLCVEISAVWMYHSEKSNDG